jgi:L-ascorbate metabolism protein UlaG (beta-lactamase superfamily)
MRLTKHGHACVRLDTDGASIVIDPGTYSPDADLTGVGDLRVHAPADVVDWLSDEHGVEGRAVAPGDTFEVAGLDVAVVGGEHAEIYDGLPGCANVGYLVRGVYHPGDALHVPDVAVETLLVPVSAPWLKLAEALDFVRVVRPERAFPVHDAMLSEIGAAGVDRWMETKGATDYRRLAPGESAEL